MSSSSNNLSPSLESRPIEETRSIISNPKLDHILDQYLDDLQNGRACSREELLAQYPDLSEDLAEYLDGIEMVSGLGVGSDLVPQKLGDFEIVRPIGRGAMGVVYLANQISLKRPVALKVLRYSVTGKQATARFEREAELVATLQHPHIVPIYATGKHDNHHFLAMQLIDGPSLSQWSAAEDADRDPTTLAKWGAEVARALAHAHQRDVIHRDVKPSNLLQDKDQKVWLTDFGLARRFDDLRMSMTGAMLGTPNYMSPEQASPSRYPIDHRTDIYSLGATLFELLTGRCVFLAETPHAVLAQVLTEEPPMLRELLPDASRDLETILMKCLDKEPHDRYQTADQLADDLEAFAEGRSIKARRPSVIERAIRWKRHNQKAVSWATTAVTVAFILLASSLAAWTVWRDSHQGSLKINSAEGPIIARLIDSKGEPSPTFTIPAQQKMKLDADAYQLEMWAPGRIGETQNLFVSSGEDVSFKISLPDKGVFPERTISGIPQNLPLETGDDLVLIHQDGISRLDGRTGETIWKAKSEIFIEPMLAKNENLTELNDGHTPNLSVVRPVAWDWSTNTVRTYDERRIPVVTPGFPDINADGEQEVLVACHTRPLLFVLDGATGKLLWHYIAAPTTHKEDSIHQHVSGGGLYVPRDIGDVDGDGTPDFAMQFYSEGNRFVFRWLDAISGKTGKRIWRTDFPKSYFNQGKLTVPSACQLMFHGHAESRYAQCYRGGQWDFLLGNQFGNRALDAVVPWPILPVQKSGQTGEACFIVCGSKLISVGLQDGQLAELNQSQPLELGFFPALEPKWIETSLSDKPLLLLCEQVSYANGRGTNGKLRFSAWSVEEGKQVWSYDAIADSNWTGQVPSWPLLSDLTGDGIAEIVIADGANLDDLPIRGEARVQALDATTGKPIWSDAQRATIRCLDRQIQHMLTGPDADGDGLKDVYVVSCMRELDSQTITTYVDILCGLTGKPIRSVRNQIPSMQTSRGGLNLQQPFFQGIAPDGYPILVLARKSMTRVMSTASTWR